MYELETERLFLRTNCRTNNGVFTYPDVNDSIDLLNIGCVCDEDQGFAIYLKSGELIGHIGIMFKRKPYELTVGIKEDHRKKGYMKEAMGAAITWLFDCCKTDKLFAIVGPITPDASRKLMKRFGFHRTSDEDAEWWVLERSDLIIR